MSRKYLKPRHQADCPARIDKPWDYRCPCRMALTKRQKQIIILLWDGKTVKEVASELNIHFKGVETHLNGIYDKLGVDNRVSAMRVALQRGILNVYKGEQNERGA